MAKEDLVGITKEEYESSLITTISMVEANVKNLSKKHEALVAVYKNYKKEEREYIIHYYKNNNGEIVYQKTKRDPIGFKSD